MIKKSTIIKLAASAGLMTSFALTTQYSNINVFTPQTVQASSKFRVKLTHNAYIYNYRGKRRGRKVLKKGRKYTAYRTKRIHHKKYYYLGHHNYIKAGNAKNYKHSKENKSTYLFTVKLNPGAEIDLKPEGQISPWDMYGTVKVYQVKSISGHTWYKLGNNRWVNASDTNRKQNVNSEKNSKSEQSSSNYSDQTYSNQQSRGIRKLNNQEIQEVKDRFIQDVNNWRKNQGLKPYQSTSWINSGSQLRAEENITNFMNTSSTTHTRPNGEKFWTAFANPENTNGEVLDAHSYQDESTKDIADGAFNSLVYNDADSNWGHRKELGWNYEKPIMGVGVASVIKDGEAYIILCADMGNGY